MLNFDENEPQSVREERFAAERARTRAARRAAPLDLRGAHLGALIVTLVAVVLAWNGERVALGIAGGIVLLWFAIGLAWAYGDGDHGRHALQRAYNITFGWAGGL
ncbi:hypothetical protein [Streptomyces sp. t39]|uniref:hypothetical protein n=1 Tax=Streptomyces sp. t39 TaxID=1828156 RepID=UPI0011CE8395|nr:hypothetical protein [Streptomyces sp. t39]TXS52266.1 hypothetical protein EAO77_20920 [Streptomyces sp. t39]